MSFRYMRMLLFFDLPRTTSKEISDAARFVKRLKGEGFIMLQESVYCKLLLNMSSFPAVKTRIEKIKPKVGNILLLTITEKQFSAIDVILGEMTHKEVDSTNRVIIV